MIVIAIIIFAVLAAGGYGYYFWITRQNSPEIQTPAIQTPSASPSEVPLLSTDKPNYLNIDLENTDSAQIKEMLIKNAQDVSMLQANTLVEFIAVDQQNNPLNFQGFAQKAGINLPAEILAGLGTNFSVFVYNDNGKARLGIAIDSKDITEKTLQKNLLAKEPLLPKILEPLYLPTEYTIEDKTFATSYYGGAEIRYFNITSPEELSVDYTIFRNKLLIGTNKMTLRSMID